MAESKLVYVSKSDPNVWFYTEEEVDTYDKAQEISKIAIGLCPECKPGMLVNLISALLDTYTIEKKKI